MTKANELVGTTERTLYRVDIYQRPAVWSHVFVSTTQGRAAVMQLAERGLIRRGFQNFEAKRVFTADADTVTALSIVIRCA